MAIIRSFRDLKKRGSVSRSTVENQNAIGPSLRSPIANPLRVADPRSVPLDQIKTLPNRDMAWQALSGMINNTIERADDFCRNAK